MKTLDNLKSRDRLVELIEGAIDTEYTMSICCWRLSLLIKNGRVRKKFRDISGLAKRNENLLMKHLSNLGVDDFILKNKCKFCKVDPASFSTFGALELGMEIVNIAIKFYKALLEYADNKEDAKLFKGLLIEKVQQKGFLKKEKGFNHEDEVIFNRIRQFCIPEVISKLWK